MSALEIEDNVLIAQCRGGGEFPRHHSFHPAFGEHRIAADDRDLSDGSIRQNFYIQTDNPADAQRFEDDGILGLLRLKNLAMGMILRLRSQRGNRTEHQPTQQRRTQPHQERSYLAIALVGRETAVKIIGQSITADSANGTFSPEQLR